MTKEELTELEKKKLLDASNKIYEHRLIFTKAFSILAKKAEDQRIKQILKRIEINESTQAEFWFNRIKELGGKSKTGIQTYLRELKVGFMMRILGTKNFFEWGVKSQSESIENLSIQAEKIRKKSLSENWSRITSDERIHLERMKTEMLGMHSWEIRSGGGVRDMIFGANDGLVSTLAFVAGVVGATTNTNIVLLSGVAELFAGTISMAVGSYQASKSELEVIERQNKKEQIRGKTSEEEMEDLILFYENEGFKKGEAEAIAKRMIKEKEHPFQISDLEKLGLSPKKLGNPVKSGALCGLFFGLAALVPIFTFAIPLNIWEAMIISIIASMICLFGVGAIKTIFSRKNWVWSGLEMMGIGASAAAITYVIGTLFSIIL